MKAVVLGTGMIGGMMVRELAKSSAIESLIAVDVSQDSVAKAVAGANNPKVTGKAASLAEADALEEILREADLAIASLPHALSLPANKAAIKAGCHLVDLVGSGVPDKLALAEEAKKAGVLLVPGIGVAPGLANVLAGRGIELLDEAEEAQVYCGGLPRYPLPPLWYQVVFRLESVLGLYSRPAAAVIDGEMVSLPALSGMEDCRFPEPVGECEAVITDAHSLGFTMKGMVKNIYEKTIRYKGHYQKVKVLSELGFFNDKPLTVDGQQVSPRRMTMALLEPLLKGKSEEDITALRVVVSGTRNGRQTRLEWEMVDLYDHDRLLTSMAKTTGFPAVVVAEWLAEGRIPERGVVAPEQLLIGKRFEPFMTTLAQRGIHVSFRESVD